MAKATAFVVAVTMMMIALPALTFAVEYIVGDASHWTAGVDYNQWLTGKQFYVGDVLVFYYDPSLHNVVVVDGDGFGSCAADPNIAIYDSGQDRLSLPVAGNYYFICQWHCADSQQKLVVNVT